MESEKNTEQATVDGSACSATEKELEYHRAGHTQRQGGQWRKPRWVPSRVRVVRRVVAEVPGLSASVMPGDYECECNQYGAVSVRANDGEMLGLRLDEFEPLNWRENR